MSFLNRFSFFFIVVIHGVLVLYVYLKCIEEPLTFNYFPNSRIKSQLINSDVLISKKALCKIQCMHLDTIVLDHYISDGNIDIK